MTVAITALLVNETVFSTVTWLFNTPIIAASILGILVGALLTFRGNNGITFRGKKGVTQEVNVTVSEQLPAFEDARMATSGNTLAYFMPAYREGENLPHSVGDLVAYLRTLAFKEFRVIIVNDGSPDNTGNVANKLAQLYSEVVVYHHTVNRGYGGALITGFKAVVTELTKLGKPFDLWAFSDSDRQFRAESLGTLLVARHEEDADMVVGYRLNRESRFRRWLGRAWHHYGSIAVGRGLLVVTDVDCGLKTGRVASLSMFAHKLHGQKAAISPELIARSKMAGHSIEERPVAYLPRVAGTSTGANPKVMIVSGLHILLVGIALRMERYLGLTMRLAHKHKGDVRVYDGSNGTPPVFIKRSVGETTQAKAGKKRDRVAWGVGIMAALLSVAAYIVTVRYHAVLLYGDAISHLEIARRMIDGTSPGFAQLGGVWPPLPHLLDVTLAWNNKFYFDGFAGSIVSMVAYVVATVMTYKIVFRLTHNKVAGVFGAAVFALCPSMLYMQSTPMTESLLFCMLAITVYCVQQWVDTDKYQWIVGAGVAALLATLTRYESWPILAVLLVVVSVIAWRRPNSSMSRMLQRARARDRFIVFLLPAFAGIVGWAVWNWAIFGSPIAFQTGQYAKPSLWLSSQEPAIGNWWVAAKTYWYAVDYNVSWPIILIAGLGLVSVVFGILFKKISAQRVAPALTLLVVAPFYVVSLYYGQRPLHVNPIRPDLYNVRFGLVMLLPLAILSGVFVSYLTKVAWRRRPVTLAIGSLATLGIALLAGNSLQHRAPITYREAQGSQNPVVAKVATAFEQHYTGGKVLAQSFGNESIIYRIPANELIYEGSYQKWQTDLRSPSIHHIEWIVDRCGSNADLVCNTVNAGEFARYQLVWKTPDNVYRIYQLKTQFR